MTTPVSSSGSYSSAATSSSVDGLVSGLNTTALINQLMTINAQPRARLQREMALDQQKTAAYQTTSADLTAMRTAADALRFRAGWSLTTASSNDGSVTTTAAAGAAAGTVAFDVVATARAQTSLSTGTYASTSAPAASGPLTFTRPDGSTFAVPVGDGSLGAVVSAVNASGQGLRAAAVQVSPGTYRLQLQSSSTGAAAGFAVSSELTGGLTTLADAQDATITLGGDPRFPVTSASNTLTGLLPGVSITLTKPTTGVTVSIDPDANGLADKVQALVTAANKTLTGIATSTAYDAGNKTGGILVGDATLTSVSQSVLGSVTRALGGASAAAVGVSVTRDGQVTFDRATFLTAYGKDPAGTQALFTETGSYAGPAGTGGTVALRGTTPMTKDGTYDVTVTRAATRAGAVLDPAALPDGTVVTLGAGARTATWTATAGQSSADMAASLAAAVRQAGLAVSVADDAGTLRLSSDAVGSAATFSLSVNGTPAAVTAGTDVAGSINGVAATGDGNVLTAPGTDRTLAGLSLTVGLTAADLAAGPVTGRITVSAGLAQRLSAVAVGAVDPVDGALSSVIKGQKDTITKLGTRISAWDLRLAAQQSALQKQYAALEVALGKLKSQSDWLTGQLASLPTSNSSNK